MTFGWLGPVVFAAAAGAAMVGCASGAPGGDADAGAGPPTGASGGEANKTVGATGGAGTIGANGVSGDASVANGKGGTGGSAPARSNGSAGTMSTGGASSAGAGGAGPGGASGGYGGATMIPYDAHRDPNAAGILIHVKNGCPFEIWIHGAGKGAVLSPDNQQLTTGQTQDYTAPDDWPAARVTAYGAAPNAQGQPQQELDKVEMTLGKKVINYNITYVDWLGLPAELVAFGSGADCKTAGCYMPVGDVGVRCPPGLLSGKKCRSAGSYCASAANQASDFCHALDGPIAKCAGDGQKYPACAGAAGATTGQVYGCAGFFAGSPKWCSALNRGMLDDPDNGDPSLYYTMPPFNAYSQWVHSVCPGIYAFPYDDYGKTNQSGFHACSGGTQLDITFCPAG